MIGRAWLWLAGVAVLASIIAALAVDGRLRIHTDMLALLPTLQRDPVKAAAIQRVEQMGQRRLVLLISAGSPQRNADAASAAAQALADNGAFAEVLQRADDLLSGEQQRAARALRFHYRFHLLAPADRAALAQLATPPAGDDEAALRHFIGRAQARLYGFGAGAGAVPFIEDPLGLSAAYRHSVINGRALPGIRVGGDGRFYVVGDGGRRYAVLFARSKSAPFTLEAQAAQLAALAQARSAVHAVAPDASLLVTGVLPFAAAATEQARHEVSVIGVGSLLGILLLIFWAFGSIRPFLLSFAVMAGGCLLALVATTVWFGHIHVLTLVFGASIVGVAVDYCMHFFAQRWDTPSPHRAIRCILPAISMGLLTNVLAYGSMAITPFPGLRQMAVFAVFGLVGAWLGVVLLLPAWAGKPPPAGTALALARVWLERGPARVAPAHRGRVLAGMAVALVVLSALTSVFLTPVDDIGLMYEAPPELERTGQLVSQLLGTRTAGRTIAVRGDSLADVLDSQAKLVDALGGPEPVATVSAITQAFPTYAEQKRDYARLADTLYAPAGPVQQLLAKAGYSAERVHDHLQAFAAQQGRLLAFEQWLASPASDGLRRLWLGRVADQRVSLIRVHQIHDRQALARILDGFPQVAIVDPVAQISRMFQRYRDLSTRLLIAAYVVAFLLLWWPLGGRGALVVIIPPMLASVIVALLFAVTGWPFSLFNLLAMILLLGLGADYGIFLRMAQARNPSAMLAVGASAMTNLLAFGLLAWSATPALHGFGLTLMLGLALTFVFTSWVGGPQPAKPPRVG